MLFGVVVVGVLMATVDVAAVVAVVPAAFAARTAVVQACRRPRPRRAAVVPISRVAVDVTVAISTIAGIVIVASIGVDGRPAIVETRARLGVRAGPPPPASPAPTSIPALVMLDGGGWVEIQQVVACSLNPTSYWFLHYSAGCSVWLGPDQ